MPIKVVHVRHWFCLIKVALYTRTWYFQCLSCLYVSLMSHFPILLLYTSAWMFYLTGCFEKSSQIFSDCWSCITYSLDQSSVNLKSSHNSQITSIQLHIYHKYFWLSYGISIFRVVNIEGRMILPIALNTNIQIYIVLKSSSKCSLRSHCAI